jgi:hypothetical protein
MNMINIVVNPLDDEIQRLKEDNYKLSSESRVLGLPVSRGNKQ